MLALVLMLLVPVGELAALFGAAFFNRWLSNRYERYERFELVGLVILWYVILLAGGYLG